MFVEYAKAGENDVLARITVANRGPEAAAIHVLPTLWARNTWSWGAEGRRPVGAAADRPRRRRIDPRPPRVLGRYRLDFDPASEVLFTDNETNTGRFSERRRPRRT